MSYFPKINNNGLRLIISKISNSRKELEVKLVSDQPEQYETSNFNLGMAPTGVGNFYLAMRTVLEQEINSNDGDAVLAVGDGNYIPLVNLEYYVDTRNLDNTDANKYLMVIKLNAPLPAKFKKLSPIDLLIVRSEIIENKIFYGGESVEEYTSFGNPLNTDFTFKNIDQKIKDVNSYESRNELTASIPEIRLDAVLSGSNQFKERLVDYSDFNNFVFFGSAEKRVENFKTKIETIETHLTDISHSLNAQNQTYEVANTPATEIRNQSFKAIHSIINNFTDYEKWLYFDNQSTSSGSAPGIGYQYTDNSSSLVLSSNITQKFNFEGFETAYILSGSSTENIPVTTGKYKLEDVKFNNSTGSFYLSFLMRASSSISDNFRVYNTMTSSIPHYPMDAFMTEEIMKPSATGSHYTRYIFKSSGSHWKTANNLKKVGMEDVDFNLGSTDIMLTSGSGIYSSTINASGMYSQYATFLTSSGIQASGSFLPRGDLFDLNILPTDDTSLSGVMTDVKITSGDPTTIKPFSYHYPTTSTEFTNWYNGLISSASIYDQQNIQRLINNIPGVYLDNTETHNELITYVNTIGEFFDEYKTLIDDYYRLFNQGYSDYDVVPSKYNKVLAEHIGFNILPIMENNFLDMFGINESLSNSQDYSNSVINNILNNINYLYKTKGTQNSVKALLSCYGLPSNVLRLREAGSNLKAYDQSILSNDTNVAPFGIFEMTGSINPQAQPIELATISIHDSFDVGNFKVPWNSSNEITQSAIEAVIKMPETSNTMSIFSSKNNMNTDELWHLQMYPSGSNTSKGKFRLRISKEADGDNSTGIATSSLSIDTDYLDILNNEIVNIAVQKSSSGHDNTDIHTFELIVGKMRADKISFLTSSKLVINGDSSAGHTRAIKNFHSSSAGSHLFLTNDFTGSIGQVKSWSTPLSFTAFKQHIYNPKSIVGNNITASTNELQYYYPLQENYKSGSTADFRIIDASTKQKGGDVELDSNMFNSHSDAYITTTIDGYNFPIFGSGDGNLNYTENQVTIEESQRLVGPLNPDGSVLKYNDDMEEKDFIHNSNLFFTRSPQDIINDFLKDNLGNLDFNDLFADPRDEWKTTYPDLDDFNANLSAYKISVDMTKFILATKKLFNSSFIESIKKIIPAKASLQVGNVLKPTYTQRIKTPPLVKAPDSEILQQPEGTKPNLEAPSPFTTEVFTPPENKPLESFQTTTSSMGFFEQTNYGFDNVGTETTELTTLRSDDKIKNNPEKFWGSSSNDLHFKSEYGGGEFNDYNTYHYEADMVFIGFTDPELAVRTTGSYARDNTNYTTGSTFVNKKRIKTSEGVPIRDLGITQQLYPTSSKVVFGRVMDTDTLTPSNHITYLQGGYTNRNYQGTKLGPAPQHHYAGNKLWNSSVNYGYTEWEDLSTSSFYRISYEPEAQSTLRIVRPQDTNEGNAT